MAEYSILRLWSVWETVDEYARLGQFRGYYGSEKIAKEYAKGKGWYGSEGHVQPEYFLCLTGPDGQEIKFHLKDHEPAKFTIGKDPVITKKELRLSGLAKLTSEEKLALGLKNVTE